MKHNIIKSAIFGLACLISGAINGQSIFTGLRGPTTLQLDERVSYSYRESQSNVKTTSLGENTLLKFWTGDEFGAYGFVNVPYRRLETSVYESVGIGDISLGIGPRFKVVNGDNEFHAFTSLGVTLPTGDEKTSPPLGTGRYDTNATAMFTYLRDKRRFEIDGLVSYTNAPKGIQDGIDFGIVVGGRVSDCFRLVAGPVVNTKFGGDSEQNTTTNARLDLRFTPKGNLGKRFHLETIIDKVVSSSGDSSPKDGFSATLIGRYNF